MIDLDAMRAARRATKGKGPEVVTGGETYELAPEMPFAVIEAMAGLADEKTAAGALVDMARALFGEHYEAVRSGLSMEDINELVGSVMGEYGVSNAAPLPSTAS